MNCVGILLAAGASRRFGNENKLMAPLFDQPLVCHAAASLKNAGCDYLIVVASEKAVVDPLDGFEAIKPLQSEPAQADSLKTGINRAKELGASTALICLADMPFIEANHMREVAELCRPGHASATTDGHRRLPPACFPADMFNALTDLTGDQGAQAILRNLPKSALVEVSAASAQDIDTKADVRRAEETARTIGSPPQ